MHRSAVSSASSALLRRRRLLPRGPLSPSPPSTALPVAIVVRWRSSADTRDAAEDRGGGMNAAVQAGRRMHRRRRGRARLGTGAGAAETSRWKSTSALGDGDDDTDSRSEDDRDDSRRNVGDRRRGGLASMLGFGDDASSSSAVAALGPRTTYRLLGLERFTDVEIDGVFDAAIAATSSSRRRRRADAHGDDAVVAKTNDVARGGDDDAWLDHARLASYLLGRIRSDLDDVRRRDPDLRPEDVTLRMEKYASTTASTILEKFRPAASVRCDRRGTVTDEEDERLGVPPDRLVVSKSQFRTRLKALASVVDAKKALPISLSMLMIGSSVGVVTPVMPFVVENLGLSTGQYGTVVAAFALAKIVGNVPSAVLVERHGRRPYLVYSLCLVSAGVAGIGLATSWEHLFACRLLTGFGVAALSTAATMTMADISTPLNRASTMAPIMSAFSAGMAFGPAVGGMLADHMGISETFYAVGASYLGLTLVNRSLLVETKARPLAFPWHRIDGGSDEFEGGSADKVSMLDATKNALSQWSPLLSDARIRHAVMMNGFYWTSLAGSQMTLLPLLLTDPSGLALSATAVGRTYMGMSLVQVVGVPLMARFVDKVGKPRSIVAGCTLIGGSMMALPYCTTLPEMAATLGTWSLGSSILSTAPVSYVSDMAGEKRRAQAVALLRTTGDVGFLVGAGGIGLAADWTGDLGSAMHCGAGVLMGATAWFAARRVLETGTRGAERAKKKTDER